ncbi:uncharacterized protein LOC143290595 [Babylonia areolata]|uniref:uncharacterized protein LOC143290595 n=1 Tax=Babylonia areolata TaxID=304850 RepID=UPI003FD5440E
MTMSSPAANGSASQTRNQTRMDRRREWWMKNKEFRRKLRDRTVLSKKEGERQPQPPTVKVDTSRGFRSTVASKLSTAPSRSKKPLTSDKKLSAQKARSSKVSSGSSTKPQTKVPDKVEKKKPKVVSKPSPSKPRVDKTEDKVKPEMISEISMNAYGVDLTSAGNHVPQRYILFVGNLPYTIDKGQLMRHFRKTGGVKSVRIPKDKSGTPKGFAYIEFKDRISHGIALRLHHTTLGGRRINVEFSTSEAKKKGQADHQES